MNLPVRQPRGLYNYVVGDHRLVANSRILIHCRNFAAKSFKVSLVAIQIIVVV